MKVQVEWRDSIAERYLLLRILIEPGWVYCWRVKGTDLLIDNTVFITKYLLWNNLTQYNRFLPTKLATLRFSSRNDKAPGCEWGVGTWALCAHVPTPLYPLQRCHFD